MLRLAVRSAAKLDSSLMDKSGSDHFQPVLRYFELMGVTPEQFHRWYYEGKGAETDELCLEANNSLNRGEKVCLLLLVLDSLLRHCERVSIQVELEYFFVALGIDKELISVFWEYLGEDDPAAIRNQHFLLLSPHQDVSNEMLEGRWIEDNVPRSALMQNAITIDHFNGHLLVMFVDQIKSYVVRCLYDTHERFDQDESRQCRFRVLKPGEELSVKGIPVVSFSDLKSRFLQLNDKKELSLTIDHVEYSPEKGTKEIHAFSASENSGQLIGIVGREGVGKSTFLKLLAGKVRPDSGSIYINGYDLWKNKYLLTGVIGYVPEEDLLFEELSVADNLSLTARLYYSGLSRKQINDRVNVLLSRLDLLELKHIVVGNVNSKHIQPGQRRLINIALELLREPQILLVDNALSGLGMSDAARVIKVLHEYSFAGNLVITSITQADSNTFMLFDKIWIIDEGGRPVFNGPVRDAHHHLLKHLNLTPQPEQAVDPALLLDLVAYKLPDKEGYVWKRVMAPPAWHNMFLQDAVLHGESVPARTKLPARILKIPNLEVQLLIFSIRNFKCKFSRANEILKTLLIGPLIALLISGLFRISEGADYHLLTNPNLPLYQFISVVVAVFLGLIASVDEILRERDILQKEEYLEFSRFSYLNSKILYLFPVMAIQVALYVLTGNLMLGIHQLFGVYWLVLFSSACFGVLLGLIFSAGMYNRNILHKGILPFIIAVQVLLGGGIIPYEQLNLGNRKYTPLVGDLMVSRWGYEALAVEQFKNNAFEKLTYATDKKLDQAAFYTFQAVPELDRALNACHTSDNPDSVKLNARLLQHELKKVAQIPDVFRFEYLTRLDELGSNEQLYRETQDYLTYYLSRHFYEQYQVMLQQKAAQMGSIIDSLGATQAALLRQNSHNLALEETVINNNSESEYEIIGNQIVRKKGMIFHDPVSEWGRACLFTPTKRFNNQETQTLWFNISMIWTLTALCYIWALFDITGLLRKLLRIH